jgi:hypothetical protein
MMRNNIFLFLSILFSTLIFSQEEKKKSQINFQPDFALTIITNHYFGDNYLAKGHQNQSIGIQLKSDWLHYSNFSLGFGIEKSTQKVTEFSIGGNIGKTNSNSFFGYLTYKNNVNQKFSLSPEISFGGIELRQKKGEKFYGSQSGQRYGVGVNLHYIMTKSFSFYTTIGYSLYRFNANTSEEFKKYFDRSNSINLSLGIKLY